MRAQLRGICRLNLHAEAVAQRGAAAQSSELAKQCAESRFEAYGCGAQRRGRSARRCCCCLTVGARSQAAQRGSGAAVAAAAIAMRSTADTEESCNWDAAAVVQVCDGEEEVGGNGGGDGDCSRSGARGGCERADRMRAMA